MRLDMQALQQEEVPLLGITHHDIQEIFEAVVKEYKAKCRIIYLDASYVYTFHLDDFEIVRKFNILGRYDLRAVLEWHRCLERWFNDQTVTLGGRTFKPIDIQRALDRVLNEGLEDVASGIVGVSATSFPYRSIGDGVVPAVLPSDRTLAHEVNRINVLTTKEGGSLSRDGSTVYSIGNHSKSIPAPSVTPAGFTECGMHSTLSATTDRMFDHSKFVTPIPHIQNSDAPGSTTVIYTCAA